MVPQFIKLKDALNEMEKGQPFSLSFVTSDKKQKKGGRLISLSYALLQGMRGKKNEAEGQGASTAKNMDTITPENKAPIKAPRHFANSTRNIFIPASNQTRKVHIRLITRFNDYQVIY